MKLFKDNIFHDKRIKKISSATGLEEHIIEEAVSIMYNYIRLKLEEIKVRDVDSIMDEEEFNETFPSISIPKLGAFVPSYRKYCHIMRKKIKKNETKNNEPKS